MSTFAELFKAHLDENSTRYTYFEATEERNEAVKISFNGKNASSLTLFFFFDKNGHTVNIKSFEIAKTPEEKTGEMYALLNKLNLEYRWVKFFLDNDNDVTCSGDAILCEANAAEECWELLIRYLNIVEEAYPKFMKVIWG